MDDYTKSLFFDKTDEWVRDYVSVHFQAMVGGLGEFTTEEYARLLRMSKRTARDQVQKLLLENKVTTFVKHRRDQYGALRARQVYQYKEDGWLNTKSS
jgi:transcription initiation factor IIE alpha subunit